MDYGVIDLILQEAYNRKDDKDNTVLVLSHVIKPSKYEMSEPMLGEYVNELINRQLIILEERFGDDFRIRISFDGIETVNRHGSYSALIEKENEYIEINHTKLVRESRLVERKLKNFGLMRTVAIIGGICGVLSLIATLYWRYSPDIPVPQIEQADTIKNPELR